jgi:four helix bundle protein
MALTSYKELIVWQRAMELVREVYRMTEGFPRQETYGLTSQMRRAATSIPSNIAEGYARKGRAEYLQFLNIASGSAAELETRIVMARDLFPHLDFSEAEMLLLDIRKMLTVLMQRLHE